MTQVKFYLFLLCYIGSLFYLATTLPIGPHEAWVFYTDRGLLYVLTHLTQGWFGNSLEFRLPFLFFGLLNIALFFQLSLHYFDEKEQNYLVTTIFALLPGIITSAILTNIATIVITLVLGFLIFYLKKQMLWQGVVMVLLLFIHDASIIFFIALSIFSAFQQDKKLFYISISFTAVSLLYFNELDIGGKPTGEFLQLFGLYMALFSPLVFLYFFYALYRIWLREDKDILWYISFIAFVLSILLSLRQQVIMTDFAPYVIVAVILMMVSYHQSIYIRLPQFQKGYRLGFKIVLASLLFSVTIIVFHPLFFSILDDKSKHFAYPFYEPYWQVLELHEIGQDCYTVKNKKVQYQLKYYGIESCEEFNVPKIHR